MKKKEEIQTITDETVQQPELNNQPEPDFLRQYRACYPRAKRFFVTSDALVFPDNPEAADAHQNSIGRGELKIY